MYQNPANEFYLRQAQQQWLPFPPQQPQQPQQPQIISRFVTGISVAADKENFLFELINSDKPFDKAYDELVEAVKNSDLFNTEEVLKKLESYKGFLSDAQKVYFYKRQVSDVINPIEMVPLLSNKPKTDSLGFYLMLLSMMNIGRCINTAL